MKKLYKFGALWGLSGPVREPENGNPIGAKIGTDMLNDPETFWGGKVGEECRRRRRIDNLL